MLNNICDWIKNLIKSIFEAFSSFFDWIWGLLKSLWSAIELLVRQAFNQALSLLSEVLETVADTLGNSISGFLSSLGIGNFVLLAGSAIIAGKIYLSSGAQK